MGTIEKDVEANEVSNVLYKTKVVTIENEKGFEEPNQNAI